jgi:hypothetical protein
MTHHHNKHDATTSSAFASLSSYTDNMAPLMTDEEAVAEVDEPPEHQSKLASKNAVFQRTTIRRSQEATGSSLLTQALQKESEDEHTDAHTRPSILNGGRRRSMTSTVSLASTADLTSDTGFTSPSRMSTPSPPMPQMRMLRLNIPHAEDKDHALDPGARQVEAVTPKVTPKVDQLSQPQPQPEPQKRKCISFACAAKPTAPATLAPVAAAAKSEPDLQATVTAQPTPRRPFIQFACPTKRTPSTPRPTPVATPPRQVPTIMENGTSPTTLRKSRSPAVPRSPRATTPKRAPSNVNPARSKKYLTADSKELTACSGFCEFATDEHREDDWIRYPSPMPAKKLTINDTLLKENAIRKLGTEAEEEAEEEEQEEEELLEADEDPENADDEEVEDDPDGNDDHEDGELDVEDDNLSGYDSDDGSSGGYHTDEETGFADSDEEDDEDGLHLWTPGRAMFLQPPEPRMPRRSSLNEVLSDSSIATRTSVRARRGSRTRHIKIRPGTPELPDSTDFVCGTLDEDRPIEDAYISCMAARKLEKTQLIPQDIDPSFPASDPENEEDEEYFNPVHRESDDDVWLHGEMEDLHHEQDRSRRKRKVADVSPKRYHSPPPKHRHHSPPPKTRGRSPPTRRLFDRQSPRRMKSPPPAVAVTSPPASPRCGGRGHVAFNLGTRPGLTQTKSLPRPPALFPQLRKGRGRTHHTDGHVRGAIDIFKGLQQKRQRRKEKFYQAYCNRARKGQIPERKPQPGQGAERMRELGLLMAGKIEHEKGNYVLSI